ncbi:MAG: terminase family protein [Hassallia sp. WJT32-NPBG1]|jgi:phage terminase large subunit-like protein|nr:terminase family protein [Hassallia sp. WJT32-NPBG1]
MPSIETRLKQLEKRISEQQTAKKLKSIPENWEDFIALTTIRSGGEMKPFIAYEYQKILIRLMQQYPNIVVLKSRQMGTTQCILSKYLHDSCVNPASSNIMFMRNGDDASAICRRARQMLLSIPEYATADSDSVGYLKIKGKGDLYFKNSGKEGSRSLDSMTGMLFDEAAFVENVQQIYAASSPSGALSGDKISKLIVSTPSAKSGFYWDKLNENNGNYDIESIAADVADGLVYTEIPGIHWFVDKAGCCKLILHFRGHPIYSQIPNYLEYRLQQDGTDEETIQREYNLKFVDSAVAVFESDLIRKNVSGSFESFVDDEAHYYCGLDTSTVGLDFCVFSVLKFKDNKYSIVCQYRKRQETSDYHLFQIGKLIDLYQPQKVGIEVTGGVGQVFLEQLSRQHKHIRFEAIKTTQDSKATRITLMQLALEQEVLSFPANSVLIQELLSFRRIGHKLEAAQSKHDDSVMSTSFALAVTPFNREKKSVFNF